MLQNPNNILSRYGWPLGSLLVVSIFWIWSAWTAFAKPLIFDYVMLVSLPSQFLALHPFSFLPESIDPGHPLLYSWLLGVSYRLTGLPIKELQSYWGLAIGLSCLCIVFPVFSSFRHRILFLFVATSIVGIQTLWVVPGPDSLMMVGVSLGCLLLLKKEEVLLKGPLRLFIPLALMIITLSSTRGLVWAGVWTLAFTWLHMSQEGKSPKALLGIAPLLLLGWAPILIYQTLHFKHFGWALTNPLGEWSTINQALPINQWPRKLAGTLLKALEGGQAFVWVLAGFACYRNRATVSLKKPFALWALGAGITLLVLFATRQTPVAVRYFLPLTWLVAIIAVSHIQNVTNGIYLRTIALVTIGLVLQLGIPRPHWLSKSWDSDFTIMPAYAEGLASLEDYLEKHQISPKDVGSLFPLHYSMAELYGQKIPSTPFADLGSSNQQAPPYILYSPLYNSTVTDFQTQHPDYLTISSGGRSPLAWILLKKKPALPSP